MLPGAVTERPAAEMEKDGQQYVLDAEKSGWYNGEDKVASVTAEEGKTVTYRAYYEAVKAVEKAALDAKIQAAEAIAEDRTTQLAAGKRSRMCWQMPGMCRLTQRRARKK